MNELIDGSEHSAPDERWRFHVEVLSKEIEALRQENEKLRSLAIRSLDQSVALLDRIARFDGGGADD